MRARPLSRRESSDVFVRAREPGDESVVSRSGHQDGSSSGPGVGSCSPFRYLRPHGTSDRYGTVVWIAVSDVFVSTGRPRRDAEKLRAPSGNAGAAAPDPAV